MWIFTNDAFISAVQDKKDSNLIMCRARIMGDLEAFLSFAPKGYLERSMMNGDAITETNEADYRFRLRMTRNDFEQTVLRHAMGINYTNFKSSIVETSPTGKERHRVYLQVWHVMNSWQLRWKQKYAKKD